MTLSISPTFSLPDEAITETFGIIAKRGAGKTYTASVMAEEMIAAELPFVVLDPTGAWYGLRAPGPNSAGEPVIIIGGQHGDIPLEPTGGKMLAELVVEYPNWYIIDLSMLESQAAQDRIVEDFATSLYRLKASHPAALHLFLDEADSFAPQRPFPNQTKMLGAIEALVRRGRSRGLGMTLITQRPAVLNKNVLSQVECLIILQTTAPQDRAAIDDWVKGNASAEDRALMLGGMASLQKGEAWVWSPAWLETLQRVQIRPRLTFNSSATPSARQAAGETTLLPVDIDAARSAMAATIARAQENDPKELKKKIEQLRRSLEESRQETAAAEEAARISSTQAWRGSDLLRELDEFRDRAMQVVAAVDAFVGANLRIEHDAAAPAPRVPKRVRYGRKLPAEIEPVAFPPTPGLPVPMDDLEAHHRELALKVGKAGLRIMSVLLVHGARNKRQLALLSGYTGTGGAFNGALATLKKLGWMTTADGLYSPTSDAKGAGITVEQLPHGRGLLEYWMASLSKAQASILQLLVQYYPERLTKNEVGRSLEYEPSGGAFNGALAKLRTLELIERGAMLRAHPDFMESIK